MKLKGKIITLVVQTHLGTACGNMLLYTILIMYLHGLVNNELWLGARRRVAGFSFVLVVKRKLMG